MSKWFLLFYFCIDFVFAYQCINPDNKPVDWFIVYKLPLEDKNDNQLIKTGSAFVYMSSVDYENGWKLSGTSINDSSSLVGLTLKPLFDSQNLPNTFYILYNDELPDGSINFRKGHTKGVVLGNQDGGLWLVHSVPRFPSIQAGKYFFSHNGFQYGQSFLCVSFDLITLNKIGKQLQYNEPSIYASNLPELLKSKLPNMEIVINNIPIDGAPWYNLATVPSVNGIQFLSFAKGKKFKKQLYEDWVAPALNQSLLVESWLNAPGHLPSSCYLFMVENVQMVNIKIANLQFKSSTDHSKWAISLSQNSSWTCIGDINRVDPEKKRAGGTLCLSNTQVAKTYHDSINAIETCK